MADSTVRFTSACGALRRQKNDVGLGSCASHQGGGFLLGLTSACILWSMVQPVSMMACRCYFPRHLCFRHSPCRRATMESARVLYGPDAARVEAWIEDHRELLYTGRALELVTGLKALTLTLSARAKRDASKREASVTSLALCKSASP